MFEEELRKKIAKGKNYAEQPERYEVCNLELKMKSLNGERDITYKNGNWSCTCDFFPKANICPHIIGAKESIKFKINENNINENDINQ